MRKRAWGGVYFMLLQNITNFTCYNITNYVITKMYILLQKLNAYINNK